MKASFSEVLAREAAVLAGVSDPDGLNRWRGELLELAMDAQSVYAQVLQPNGDPEERAHFLENWRDLIAAALARVARASDSQVVSIDAHKMAVSVVAALYGGAVLSRVAQEPAPMRVSVELALAPLLPPGSDLSAPAEASGLSVQ